MRYRTHLYVQFRVPIETEGDDPETAAEEAVRQFNSMPASERRQLAQDVEALPTEAIVDEIQEDGSFKEEVSVIPGPRIRLWSE